MNQYNSKLTEVSQPVLVLPPQVPSSAVATPVSLKNYGRVTFVVMTANDSTGGTAAIALSQATSAAGAGAKTLAFTSYDGSVDVSVNDALTGIAVVSNTFNTNGTASKNGIYVIDVKATDLDVTNGFDFVTITVGNQSHQTVTVLAILRAERYGQAQPMPSGIS